jgi:trk system potassium uptake protein TrkA
MTKHSRSFAVIGLGTFGRTVATELSHYGNPVLGFDIDEAAVSDIADTLDEAVIADARNERALRDAGVEHCSTAVVAIGEDLEANIVCTMNLKQIGVGVIWVKAMSRIHHRILSRLGVDRIIHAEREMGQHVAEMLHNPIVRDYLNIDKGLYIVNILVPEHIAGQQLASLKLKDKFNLRCLELVRDSQPILTDNNDPSLMKNDRLLVIGKRSDLRTFGDSL